MSVLFFLLLLYALYIASIPFRVSTTLKPAQQLNRSLSRRSIISCWPVPALPALSLLLCDSLKAGRASFHPAKSFLSHSIDMRYPQRLQCILGVGCRLCYFADRRPRLRSRYSEEPSGLLPIPQAGAAKQKCAIVALGGFSSSSVHCCAAFRTIGHSGSRFSAALLAASLAALQYTDEAAP
ncbi:hypothetical protein EMIHUDRAFT_236588 [Emiliania huxleyi CCMP1516]|uniref:Secreted protein n=2 Tax=Emiliania huxleyi TaxID=2903 RepID=A0A0D3JT42_EMIH1|nr:hypothetical protein EMIHUDRAFT_236588 [Emiliania huxleyi CCMP1516]EOD26677.1 hypothetical protein EMIHUDRAFT_236588 [Emiliania huxleyi CCMP1516]|eukprot:XP_005779106.1 hypothetical protein EMIHUDRAFT_236588 [Emiliania huxleyi CCMP1516]